jgi:hypothetical protein
MFAAANLQIRPLPLSLIVESGDSTQRFYYAHTFIESALVNWEPHPGGCGLVNWEMRVSGMTAQKTSLVYGSNRPDGPSLALPSSNR